MYTILPACLMGAVGVSRLAASANHSSEKPRILPSKPADTRSVAAHDPVSFLSAPRDGGRTYTAAAESRIDVFGNDPGRFDLLQHIVAVEMDGLSPV